MKSTCRHSHYGSTATGSTSRECALIGLTPASMIHDTERVAPSLCREGCMAMRCVAGRAVAPASTFPISTSSSSTRLRTCRPHSGRDRAAKGVRPRGPVRSVRSGFSRCLCCQRCLARRTSAARRRLAHRGVGVARLVFAIAWPLAVATARRCGDPLPGLCRLVSVGCI